MHHTSVQPSTLPLSALVVGNLHNLGLQISSSLITQQVAVDFLAPDADIFDQLSYHQLLDTGNFSHPNPPPPDFNRHFSYVFHLFSVEDRNLDHLKISLDLAVKHSAKFCLITSHPLNSAPTTSQAQTLVKATKSTQGLNVRVVHLNHLYGPYVSFSDPTQLSFLFSKIHQGHYLLFDHPSQPVFPLFTSDAVSGILRSMFSSGSQGKIYELAGNNISLINFCLKIRDQAVNHGLSESNSTLTDSIPPIHHHQDQIIATRSSLRWSPQVTIEEGIRQTLITLLTSVDFAQKQTPPDFLQTPTKTEPPLSTHPSIIPKKPPLLPPPTKPDYQPEQLLSDQIFLPPDSFAPQSNQVSQTVVGDQAIINSPHPRQFSSLNSNTKLRLSSKTTQFFLGLILIFIVVFTPFLVAATTLYQTTRLLNSTLHHLSVAEIQPARLQAQKANSNLSLVTVVYHYLYPVTNLIIGDSAASNIDQLLILAQTVTRSIIDSTTALTSTGQLINHLTGRSRGDLNSIIQSVFVQTNSAYHQLSQVQARLDSSHQLMSLQPFSIGSGLKQIHDYLPEFRHYLENGQQLLTILPDLIGNHQKKTYLVLLQNNAELRPTGGFIGSFALVTFESGVLLDIKVEDVYAADGQLKGHVEPPEPIKKYLGEAGWFLRDSNWDPDFPTTAARTAWFLEKELGYPVDGVVALNLTTIQSLLKVVGPIPVPDYEETVTADNLFERVEYQVEINQFPGSTQKRDFIGKLSKTMIDKIISSTEADWYRILFALVQSADQGQLLVSVTHPQTQAVFESLGWNGRILQPACPQPLNTSLCLPDYLSVIEANVGVNKANYFVKRSLYLESALSATGTIDSTLTINQKNDSPGDAWPGGAYKNYLRIYTPLGSNLSSVSINQQPIDPSIIDISTEHQKTVFGFLVETRPGKTNAIKVNYQPPFTFTPGTSFTYSLTFQKQSGTNSDPLTFDLKHPNIFTPIPNADFTHHQQTVKFNSALSQHQSFTVEFTP